MTLCLMNLSAKAQASGVKIDFGSARGRRDDEPSLNARLAQRKGRIKPPLVASRHLGLSMNSTPASS